MFWLYLVLVFLAITAFFIIFFAGSRRSRKNELDKMAEYYPGYEKMEAAAQPAGEPLHPEKNQSLLYGVIAKLGYQKARLEEVQKQADARLQIAGKLQKTRIVYKIVKFLGLKTSAKLALTGYRLKKKVDGIKEHIRSGKAAAA